MHKFLNAVALAVILAGITTWAQEHKYLAGTLDNQAVISTLSPCSDCSLRRELVQRNYSVQVGDRLYVLQITPQDSDWAADPLQKPHKGKRVLVRFDADEKTAWVHPPKGTVYE